MLKELGKSDVINLDEINESVSEIINQGNEDFTLNKVGLNKILCVVKKLQISEKISKVNSENAKCNEKQIESLNKIKLLVRDASNYINDPSVSNVDKTIKITGVFANILKEIE